MERQVVCGTTHRKDLCDEATRRCRVMRMSFLYAVYAVSIYGAADLLGVGTLIAAVSGLVGAAIALYKARADTRVANRTTQSAETETALRAMTEVNQRLIVENERLDKSVSDLRDELHTVRRDHDIEIGSMRRDLGRALADNVRLVARIGAMEVELAQMKRSHDGINGPSTASA